MKQTKLIKIAFIAILVLLIFTLFACNQTDKKNDSSNTNNENNVDNNSEGSDVDIELSDDMKQLIDNSRDDIDAAFNYFLTAVEAGKECYMSIAIDSKRMRLSNYVTMTIDDGYSYLDIYKNEECAQEAYSSQSVSEGCLEGNKIIVTYNELYGQIIKSKRPSNITKFTQEQMQFMESKLHRGAGKNESYTEVAFSYYENHYALLFRTAIRDVEYFEECYQSYDEKDQPGFDSMKKFMSINYTDDSYINIDEDAGTVSLKLTSKPGWHVEEISESIWNEQTHDYEEIYTGKYEARYHDLSSLPSTLTIPANVGGYNIERAEVNIKDGDTLESLIIEKEMGGVNLSGQIKHIIVPTSEEKMLEINYNTALETINFGGTMDEWNAMYAYDAQRWTKVTNYNLNVTTDVSFTVVCTNGSISYPKV